MIALRTLIRRYLSVLALLVTIVSGLTACTVLPPAENLLQYRLPVHDQVSDGGTPLPVSVLVRTPYAGTPINSSRIVVVPPGSREISAYAGVRWQDSAHILWRNRLARAFRASGRLAAVTVDASLVNASYELAGELQAFQVEHPEGQPVVHLRYDALLVDAATNSSLASEVFEVAQPVMGKEVPEVVEAFGLAGDQLATQIVQWVNEQMASQHALKKQKTTVR